jgi:hypothetical protein
MAQPSETPPGNINNNSHFITTIQPATKLGGRGTPRRKTRRPNNNNHSAVVAARTLENKLKPFRTQFQLQDQQELCDVTILYNDGRVDIQKQVHMYSTWPMTIHEIDSSETGTQTYHINDFDSISCEYLFGNIDNLQNEFNNQQSITLTKTNDYYNDLQQSQVYSQPSRYYMNYVSYQQNPYTLNSYENYSNSIRQVYGGVNTQSDDENNDEHQSITKISKRKRHRRKHAKTPSEQLLSEIPKQEEKVEVIVDEPIEHIENENVNTTKTKRKRRRVRKSKKSLSSSSLISEHPQSSQSEIHLLSSLIDEPNNQDISLLSLTPPTQHAELIEKQELKSTTNGIYANRNASTKDAMNVIKNGEKKKEEKEKIQPTKFLPRIVDDITPTLLTHTPTVAGINVDKTEHENEKITHPVIDDASITTIATKNNPSVIINNKTLDQHVLVEEFNTQKQPLSDHIQVNILYILYKKYLISINRNIKIKNYR